MTTKNITLKKLGKRFVATILAVAMIVSTITIQSTNNVVGAEETAKSTDGYVIKNTSNNTINVVIDHMLGNEKIYTSDDIDLTPSSKINNYKKAANYAVDSVSVIIGNNSKNTKVYSGEQINSIDLSSSATVKVNYSANKANYVGNPVFYDYTVKAGETTIGKKTVRYSINMPANYANGDNRQKLSAGIGNADRQYSDYIYNWPGNIYTGNSTVVTGLLNGIDENNNVVFNYADPGFFVNSDLSFEYNNKGTKETRYLRKVYSDYKLNFNQIGDNYKLSTVEDGSGKIVANAGDKFFPLDDVKPAYEAENSNLVDTKNNAYFGMRYDVMFTIGDYIGDMNYSFTGDDDLWVVLDNEKVIIDLGGIHDAATSRVDVWEALEITDRNNLTEEQKNKEHKLSILYMERGAYESNCNMEFTLPNARVVDVTDAPKANIEITKVDSSNNNPLANANFELTDSYNQKNNYKSDSNGKINITNLIAGEYTLKEISAPNGYEITESTYKIIVTDSTDGKSATAKLYKSDGITEISSKIIQNDPIIITSDDIKTNKTAKVLNWDDRRYQVDLYAAHDILPIEKPLNLALMLDFSGSMPWFVTKPTGGEVKYSQLNTKSNRSTYTLRTGGSEGVSAWSEYKYYVLRDGEGSSKEYKPVAYLTSSEAGKDHGAGWYAIASDSDGSKARQTAVDINERIYVRGEADQTKLEALQTAITNFIENLKVVSPNSKVAIIPYAGMIITGVKNTNSFISIDSVNVNEIFSKIKLYGGTQQELALNKATELLRNNNDKDNTYGILFSDGDRSNGNEYIVTNAANSLKRYVNLLFTAGIFGDMNSSGANNMNTWASSDPDDGTKKLVYIRNTANDLIDAFSDIFGYITVQLKDVTITDYIDERFDITDENGNKLEIIEGQEINFAGGKVGRDAKGVYIRWDNVTLSYAQDLKYGWHRTIYVKAKADYIGGNNVKTNIDNISNVKLPDNTTKPFDTPTVNVKISLLVDDLIDVLFKGETYGINDIVSKMFNVNDLGFNDGYEGVDLTKFEYKWYSDSALTNEVALSDIKEDTTYYLKVVYNNVVSPTEQSNKNTTLNNVIYNNDSNGVQALNKNDVKLNYGKLEIKFVAGRLAITKEIDSQYTDEFTASKTNATQTFVFKVEQYASKGAYDNNESALKTLYETITFNANEKNTSKTKFISELEKGYYVVTEETSWSSKYSIAESINKVQTFAIGDLSSTDSNGKKTFTGLDDNKDCKYTDLANGKAATFKYKNILRIWNNWHSDTGSAKNIFNKK